MNYLLTLDGLLNADLPAGNAEDFVAVFVSSPANGAPILVNGLPAQVGDLFICQVANTPAATPANWTQQSILLMPLPLLAPYLPDYFQSVQEYQALLATEQGTLTQLQGDLAQLAANLFVQTCDLLRLVDFENIFGIVAAPADDQTFRRKRVLNRFAQTPPYTMPYLQQLIENLVGAGNAVVLVNDAIGYNYMLGTNGWFLGSWMAGIHAGSTNLPFLTPGFQLYIGFIPTVTSYETEVLATIAAIVPCHMEVVICTLLFETVSTGVNPSLLTDALLVMSNGVNIDIPNVLHIGSQDSLGRIPIAFTINYSDICGAYPAGDPSGIVHQIGLHNSSFSVEFVQVLLGTILSNIQIPVSGSVNIMFLITVA